jgi:peptidoglycan/xylan/chitin deacetylase (PgdA/CDA1 family)
MGKFALLISIMLADLTIALTQPAPLRYTIAKWHNESKAAVSLTFDDGISGQFTLAVPLLNSHHMLATFFVTTKTLVAQLGNWQLAEAAASAGHEIANHSLTHPHFNAISPDTISYELSAANMQIEDHIKPARSLTHAYPYGEGGLNGPAEAAIRAVVRQQFIAARATRNNRLTYNKYNFADTNDDYYTINSDMIADSASMAGFPNELDSCIAAGGWYVPTYHGIEDGWLITPVTIFKNHLAELEKRKALLWIAPFVNVVKYHKERNCATLTLLSETSKSLQIILQDTLSDETVWNEPLTIRLAFGGKAASVRQGTSTIPFVVSGDEIIFNAVPGKDAILISRR